MNIRQIVLSDDTIYEVGYIIKGREITQMRLVPRCISINMELFPVVEVMSGEEVWALVPYHSVVIMNLEV